MKTTKCLYDADKYWGLRHSKTLTPFLPDDKFEDKFTFTIQYLWQKRNFFRIITV